MWAPEAAHEALRDLVRQEVRFEAPAREAVLVDHLAEVEHARERIRRLEGTIDTAVAAAPASVRAVIEAFRARRMRAGTCGARSRMRAS